MRIISEIFLRTLKGIKLCMSVRQLQNKGICILQVAPKVPSVAADLTIILLQPQKRPSLDARLSSSTKAEHSGVPVLVPAAFMKFFYRTDLQQRWNL